MELIPSFIWQLKQEDHFDMARILKTQGMKDSNYNSIITVPDSRKELRSAILVHAMYNMMEEGRITYNAVKHLLSSLNNKDVDMLLQIWEDYSTTMTTLESGGVIGAQLLPRSSRGHSPTRTTLGSRRVTQAEMLPRSSLGHSSTRTRLGSGGVIAQLLSRASSDHSTSESGGVIAEQLVPRPSSGDNEGVVRANLVRRSGDSEQMISKVNAL